MARHAKYLTVAEQLQQRITAGTYAAGEPLPTEVELAREFAVNRLTLRKALDLLEQDRLVIRRHGCGTFANPPAARPMPATLLYVGATAEHFYSSFYQALCAEAQDRGKVVTAFEADTDRRVAQLAEMARECPRLICLEENWRRIRDVVPEDAWVTRVSGSNGIQGLARDERPGYVLSVDPYRAARLAVAHLAALGHRRIAFVDWAARSAEQCLGRITPERPAYLGYRSALFRAGLAEEYPIGIPDRGGEAFQEHHYQGVRQFLRQSPELPTAYLCAADFRAGPVMRALRAFGLRVPEDASVVGIGNTPWAQWLDTPLTSVSLGEAAMARVALMLNDDPAPLTACLMYLAPHLVERQSSGPAPGAASGDHHD